MPPHHRKAWALGRVAESQHGVVCRAQALTCGYSDSAIGRLVGSGLWVRLYPGVYRVTPTKATFEANVMALVLRAPGRAWASHRSAARLWGLDDGRDPSVEVSTTANIRRPKRSVHHVDAMPEADRRVVQGVPVTSVERTLIDVAGAVSEARLEALVVAALRVTSLESLRSRLEAGDNARFGPPHLRRLLDRWADLDAAESVLESRLRALVRRHRLPAGTPQFEIRDRDRFVARVDLAYPEHRIAIEADGFRWHGDRARWQADLARRNSLTRLGWQVLHFTWTDVEHDPVRVASEIRAALARSPKTSISPVRREKSTV